MFSSSTENLGNLRAVLIFLGHFVGLYFYHQHRCKEKQKSDRRRKSGRIEI